MKKRNRLPMTPDQIEASGRLTQAELEALAPDYIRRCLEQAENRMAGRPERSEDARRAVPPPTNRGGKLSGCSVTVDLVLENGVIKQIPQRRGWGGDTAFLDWVNFTIGEESITDGADSPAIRFALVNGEVSEVVEGSDGETPVTPDQVMIYMSNHLMHILGFGITSKREMGANFYRESWVLGDGWGMVCYGGQRGTIMVSLSGTGCAAAKEGWEGRLKSFLEKADRARLTRLDLAHDDYTGETYSVDRADEDHTNGLFNCGGRDPDVEYRGNWKRPNGKGRTLNVGNRTNGKFCRVYEKGRQLGDAKSEWVRIEVEFKSNDRVIPFDALLRPGEYLAAAYPAFAWISEKQERILTTKKVCEANVDKAVKWIRHQCGATIGLMVDLFGADEFIAKVKREGNPAWAKVPNFLLSPPAISKEMGRGMSLDVAAACVAF